jgi:glucose-6-phosphate dehydrogenase assembly protein OpcA
MEIPVMAVSNEMTVKPKEIHSALNKIWESLGQGKMRASLFNLIFYTEESSRANYIQKIAQKVVEKFPSRVIFIFSHKGNQELLETKVSVLSSTKGENEVACDLIKIDAFGKERTRIPFLILPHILPDLPVYLIWAEDPAQEDPIFLELKKFVTRLIFDSESSHSLPEFAKALLRHHELGKMDIADLNWARMESWRDVLSTTFYGQEKLQDLKQVKEMKISYNASPTPFFSHTNIQAIYLQGWLASQLKWKMQDVCKEGNGLKFSYQSETGPISVVLKPEEQPKIAPGMVLSVEVDTTKNAHYHFFCHLDQPHKITLTFSTNELCELPAHFLFPKGEKGQSLVKEICHSGTSLHYLHLLNQLAGLKQDLLC